MRIDRTALCACLATMLSPAACWADATIDEIIVVAQKREQDLQDAPVSVSVLTGRRIERAGVQDVFDASREIPSLTVVQNTSPINTSFRIRRIGNEPNIPSFEPAVGLFVDGAYRARTGVAVRDLLDIERIEVVKGPQTVLYGKNTTAGLVSILTRAPTQTFELSGRMSMGRIEGYESAGLTRVNGTVGGPLSETLSARLSGAFFEHGHTMKNLFVPDDSQDMDRYALRGQLLYAPADELSVRLIVGRFAIDSANNSEFEIDEGIALRATNLAFGVPCPVDSSTDRAFCNNHAVVTDLDAGDATLILDYRGNGYMLTSISAYEEYDTTRDFDADQLNINVVDVIDRQSSESYSQELRAASSSDGSGVEWLSGIYLHHNEFVRGDPQLPSIILGSEAPFLQFPNGAPFGQPGFTGISTSRLESDHFSVFGDVTWHLTGKFALTAGARWQSEEKSAVIVNRANHSSPSLITVVLMPATGNADLSRDTDGTSWNLTARYRWSSSLMVYASAAKGLKAGGFNSGFSPAPGASREFGDETVTNLELGAKSVLADGRIRLNASIFRAEYDDYQSAGFVSLRFRVNNAERIDVSGLELDLESPIGERLTASASISYADAKYETYTRGACYFDRSPDNADGTACVVSGSSLPLSPKLITWLNFEYEQPIRVGTVYAGLDWSWVDRHRTNATLDPRHVQAPYSVINLRAGLRFGRFDVSAWARNLGNETIVLQDGPTNLFSGDPAFARFLAAPRSYGVTLSARW